VPDVYPPGMATAPQLPGPLHVAFVRGDDYSTLLDLSISIVGYTWSAEIYSLTNGQSLATPQITVVDAAAGKFNLSLTDAQAGELPPGTLGLRINWSAPGDAKRRAFEGVCEVMR
jgi:hypothetical protein